MIYNYVHKTKNKIKCFENNFFTYLLMFFLSLEGLSNFHLEVHLNTKGHCMEFCIVGRMHVPAMCAWYSSTLCMNFLLL